MAKVDGARASTRLFPSIPQTQGVADPAVRVAIDAIRSGWELRNGISGSGDHAFVTHSDVKALITNAVNGISVTSTPTQVTPATAAVAAPALSTYLQIVNGTPSSIDGGIGGWAADVTMNVATQGTVIGIRTRAISDGSHSGGGGAIAFGGEAINKASKTGGFNNQLRTAVFTVFNEIYNSTALYHCGVLLPFRNREFTETVPARGVPPAGFAYNKHTAAMFIGDGAGRRGSFTQPGVGNNQIYCGWEQGIYFSSESLDQSNVVPNAIGINMTDLDYPAPEGPIPGGNGQYTQRLLSTIALPSNSKMSFSTDKLACRLGYDSATQKFLVTKRSGVTETELWSVSLINGAMVAPGWYTDPGYQNGYSFNQGNQSLDYFHAGTVGVTHSFSAQDGRLTQTSTVGSGFLDTAGLSNVLMSIRSGQKTVGGPVNAVTVGAWMRLLIDGNNWYFPLYS